MISRRTGYLLVGLASALFGINGIFSKAAFDAGIAPNELAAWRADGAAILLLPFLLLALRRITRADLVPIVLFGLVGIVCAQGGYYQSIARMDIAVALVIVYTGPIIVAAFQRAVHGEYLPPRAMVAMVAAVGGVAVAVLGGAGGIGAISVAGILFAVGTAFAFAGQAIIGARQPAHVPPLARTGASMLVAGAIWFAAEPIWSLPYDRLGNGASLGGSLNLVIPVWVAVAFVIIVGGVLPYVLIVTGTIRIGAGAASMTGMVEPVLTPFLAWLALGQSLSLLQLIGIGVTVACVGVVERARFRSADELMVAEI